ncbi:MAG: hypothetical protein AAF927_26665 [Bacteroidota bacterium]
MNSPFLKINFGLFALCLTLISCSTNLPGELKEYSCRSGDCTYSFQENKQIEIIEDSTNQSTFINIQEGDKIVFKYQYVADEEPNIADDEYLENIYFEIEPNAETFSFTDEQLADAKLVIQPVCFCPPVVIEPRSGILSGTRLDESTWEVTLDATYQLYNETNEISFDKKFVKN